MNLKKTFLKTIAFVLVFVFTGNCIVSGNETTLDTINDKDYSVSEINSNNLVYSTNSDFNMHKYIADNILDDSTGASSAYFNYVKSPGRFKNMGEIWFESFSRDVDFVKSVIAWESLNLALDPGDVAKKAIEAKGYYMTVLLSIMDCQSENSVDAILKSMGEIKTVSKYYQSFVKLFKEVYKNLEESDLDDILKLRKDTFTKDEVEMLRELQKEWFEKNFEESKLGQYADVFKEYMMMYDSAKTVNELIKQFESFCMIAQISDEWKECIKYMYFHCDSSNLPFYAALKDLYDIVMSDNYELMALGVVAKNKILDISASAYSTGINALLDSLLGQCPFIKGIDLGKSISKPLINMLFSTDKVIEGFYILSAYCDIIELIESAVNNAENRYISDRTPENANEFIKYIDIFFEATEIGNKLGQDFTDILYTKGVANILFRSADEYKSFVSLRKMYSDYAQEAHKRINKSWLNDLYYDYPDIYTAYAELLGSEYFDFISVTSVAFEKDSVEWGLTDAEFKGYSYEIYPSNADNKEVFFTTTDSKVAEITNDGILKVNGMGSCVITVTAFDNEDATDTLNVTVVEENGADSTPLPEIIPIQPNEPTENDFPYIVNDDGSTITVIGYKGSGTAITIPEEIDGMRVTGVGYRGFGVSTYNFASATSIVIPNGVTSIESNAFRNCGSLISLTIPDSVTNIGGGAFENCIALKSIVIPNGVTSIGGSTFSGCSSLVSLTMPDSVIDIGGWAFYNCEQLILFSIPKSIENIGYYAFSGCKMLNSIYIPKSLTSTNRTFYESGIKIAEFEEGTNKIIEGLFYGCTSLETVKMPDTITEIAYDAFRDCTGLKDIALSQNLKHIGDMAFSNCKSLESIYIPKSLTSCDRRTGRPFDNSGVKNAEFEEGTTKIIDLFSGCDSLETIKMPNTVTEIEERAFENCIKLKSVNISKKIEIIGYRAFSDCESLTSIYIPKTLTSGYCSFVNSGIKNIEFENGITKIVESLFEDCTCLENIEIPDTVIEIGDGAFSNTGLKCVTIPDSVEIMHFENCSNLKSINIPKRVKSCCLKNCSSITSIYIPKTLVKGSFEYSGIKNVEFEEGITKINDDLFRNCTSLEKIEIPDTVTDVGNFAFEHCTNLKYVKISNSVLYIGTQAFNDCGSLEFVTMSKNIKNIQWGAFFNCTNLKLIYIPNTISIIGSSAFSGCNENFTIYGISGSYAEKYAKENNIIFIPLGNQKLTDDKTAITVEGYILPNTTLSVTKDEEISTSTSITYNIMLKDGGGNPVQPAEAVTVKIPVPNSWNGNKCKVYRHETTGEYTDMKATFLDGYMVFNTDHFSEYMINEDTFSSNLTLGDVNNDSKVNDQDSILLSRYLSEWGNTIDTFAADMNGDGKVNDQDSIILARTLAGWYD